MIFGINEKPTVALAAIDDVGGQLTYGELTSLSRELSSVLPQRELVFCLCENKVGSLAGFVAVYDNKDVCLLLNAAIDRELLNTLYETYHPSYYWLPENKIDDFGFQPVYRYKEFALCSTGEKAPEMLPDLSLLMTTSGTRESRISVSFLRPWSQARLQTDPISRHMTPWHSTGMA